MNSGMSAPSAGRNMKIIAVVIAVILVVAVIGIAVTMILLTKEVSATATFEEYVDNAENKDTRKAYNNTIWALNQSLYPEWVGMIDIDEADYQIEIHSLVEIHVEDMTDQQKLNISPVIHSVEDLLNVVVQDYCYIQYNMTQIRTQNGETDTFNTTGDIACVKIDGSWYLVLMLDDLEDILNPVQVTPAASLARSTITNGEKITILAITQSDVAWDDVRIILSDESSGVDWLLYAADLNSGSVDQMNYSSRMLGSLEVCCHVTDLAGNGVVNGGDYLTLFTYGGAPTFSAGVTYAVTLVHNPTDGQIVFMTFTG